MNTFKSNSMYRKFAKRKETAKFNSLKVRVKYNRKNFLRQRTLKNRYYLELTTYYDPSNRKRIIKEELRILSKYEVDVFAGYKGQTYIQLDSIDIMVLGFDTLHECDKQVEMWLDHEYMGYPKVILRDAIRQDFPKNRESYQY